MKLLQIALSLLLVLSPIACSSVQKTTTDVHKTTSDAISNTKYGMELSVVQKKLDAQGELVLRWVKEGNHYFVIRYYVNKTYKSYCMVFNEDIFVASLPGHNFYESCEKHAVPPIGKLPFENGFESLYAELVAQKDKFPQIEVQEVAKRKRHELTKDSKVYRHTHYNGCSHSVYTPEFFYWITVTSPIWLPFVLVDAVNNPHETMRRKDYELQKKFNNLSIDTSLETVLALLGQPELSLKNIESDYEIFFYYSHSAIGYRGGKIEWVFRGADDYKFYRLLIAMEEFQDQKTEEIFKECIKEGKETLEDNE